MTGQGGKTGVPDIFEGVPASVLAVYAGKGQDRKRGRDVVAEEEVTELKSRLEKAEERLASTEKELATLRKKICGVWEHVKKIEVQVNEVDDHGATLRKQLVAGFGRMFED